MSKETAIQQGESVNLSYGLAPAEDMSTGWVCTVHVTSQALGLGGTPAITKTLGDFSANNMFFLGKLTPTETGNLATGDYWITAELDNAAQQRNAEVIDSLVVTEQGV